MGSSDSIVSPVTSEPRLTQGNLQIIDRAGLGKTDFVSTLIVYLAGDGLAKPGNIVASAFTERAASLYSWT